MIEPRERREFLSAALHKSARGQQAKPSLGSGLLKVSVELARVRIDLLTREERLADRLRSYFREYLVSGCAEHEIVLEAVSADERCPGLWKDEDAEFHCEGALVVQRDFAALRGKRTLALINADVDDSFHNLLRWFLPTVLVKKRSFLLHGACVVRDGRGYVFFGQSGAGKSTSVSLIHAVDEKVILLGDDVVIIELGEDGAALVHSAPLGCGYARVAPPRMSAPIAGFFRLRQSTLERIASLPLSQAAAALLASAMVASAGDDAERRFELALGFAGSRSPIEELSFCRDPAFWNLVLAAKTASESN